MKSLKGMVTSPRCYAIFVAAAAITAFIFPEYFDRLFLGGSFYPLGIFQRSIIAMMVGIFATLVSFLLYMFFTFIWEGSFDYPQPEPRTPRRKEGGDESYGGGFGQTVETAAVATPLAESWAGDSLFVSGETGASDMCADGSGGGDSGGSESGGGGGDYGGGGDFGGGGGGGGWS